MSQEFKREPRYIVLKIKDINNYLDAWQIRDLMELGKRIAEGRDRAGKPRFNAIVVEQDWPEFEPTWAAIESRMEKGKHEPVYAFRRKGQPYFCPCDEDRYNELAQKPTLFEVQIFYATPQPCPKCGPLENSLEQTSKTLGEWIEKVAELEKEVARLKTVPMMYRRMAFNAQLQDENTKLLAKVAELEAELEDCTASNKAVEAALKDVQYRGTYADGVEWLKAALAYELGGAI